MLRCTIEDAVCPTLENLNPKDVWSSAVLQITPAVVFQPSKEAKPASLYFHLATFNFKWTPAEN